MKDVTAGRDITIDGDVSITNTANSEFKPLNECSSDELFDERRHRNGLLKDERRKKNRKIFTFIKIAFFVILILVIWYYFSNKIDLIMFLVALLGVVLPVSTAIKLSEVQTMFELRQIAALNEIAMLLRERGVE